MSHLSSLHKRVESGPLSKSAKVDPIEEARVLAQSCHFWRSEEVAECMGGLKKSGL